MSNWDAKFYKEQACLQENVSLDILKGLSFKGNERILDIGCGNGNITQKIAGMVPRGEVIGIDASKEMINEAIADYSHVSNLTFLQKQAENFSFEKKFNLITSFFTLHWIKDHGRVLQNVKLALEKGGKLVFLMASGGDKKVAEVFERKTWKDLIEEHFNKTFSVITEKDYHRLLDRYGFEKIAVNLIDIRYQFDTVEKLRQYFMTWVPYATGLSSEKCLAFTTEIAEHICSCQQGDTGIELVTPLLLVKASCS